MSIIGKRFRGFYPVVIDVETGGFSAKENALLEVAAVLIEQNELGQLYRGEAIHFHVDIFPGLRCDPAALAFNGIDPTHPFRMAVAEHHALNEIFQKIRPRQKFHQCTRAVLVGHNAWFDLSFINAAIERNRIKRSPLHPFTSFDTASLGALVCGQSVLAKTCLAMGIAFDNSQAHSALYDAERTADLFCAMVNCFNEAVGQWPPAFVHAMEDTTTTTEEGVAE